MKKLFSILLMMVVVLTLSSCVKNDPSDQSLHQNSISIELIDGNSTSESTINLGTGELDVTLLDVLIATWNPTIVGEGENAYLTAVDWLQTQPGTYIAVSVNDEMSMVGVGSIQVEDGATYTLELVWWDTLLQKVDEQINLFLENYASDYVNNTTIDYNVLVGLKMLGLDEDYVSTTEAQTFVDGMTLDSYTSYFKAIMILDAMDIEISDSMITDFSNIATTGYYGQTAYTLMTLQSETYTVDITALEASLVADILSGTFALNGPDTSSVNAQALFNLVEGQDKLDFTNAYKAYIVSRLAETGGVVTEDIEWGGTVYPGNENGSTQAQVILGLLSLGIDPNTIKYDTDGVSVMARFLEYTTETGAFDYLLTDDLTEDLMFSTPQGFLALVTYQTYVTNYLAQNPYMFE